MTNPVPSLPVGAVRLWQWPHDKREFFAPLPDAQRPFLDSIKAPDDAVEYIALPLAAFHALAAKAARVDALATALGDAVGRLRSVVDEVRPHVRDGEDARNLREGESFLSSCDALLDAAGGKGGSS